MTQWRIDFQGRAEVETCSGARVQAMGDSVQLSLRVARQVCTLGEVLARKSSRILIDAALPRAVQICKANPDREPLGQALMLGHLFPQQQRGHASHPSPPSVA